MIKQLQNIFKNDEEFRRSVAEYIIDFLLDNSGKELDLSGVPLEYIDESLTDLGYLDFEVYHCGVLGEYSLEYKHCMMPALFLEGNSWSLFCSLIKG